VEQCRVSDGLRARCDDIPEPNIELHGDARLAEQGDKANPHALVVGVLLDTLRFDGGGVEHHAVRIDIGRAYVADHAL
jgi:hypothetical protein